MTHKVVSRGRRAKIDSYAQFTRTQLIASIDQLLRQFGAASEARSRPAMLQSATERELNLQYERLANAATALMVWHSCDEFLKADGLPMALRRSGRRSLNTLAKRVITDARRASRLVLDLQTLGLIERNGLGYVPARRSAITALPNTVSLAYATNAVWRLVATMTHNYSRAAPPRFERQIADVRIKYSDLPLFLRFVEEQGQYFIDSVDDWLVSRKVLASTGFVSIPVGIGAFAWAGRTHGVRGSRSGRDPEAAAS